MCRSFALACARAPSPAQVIWCLKKKKKESANEIVIAPNVCVCCLLLAAMRLLSIEAILVQRRAEQSTRLGSCCPLSVRAPRPSFPFILRSIQQTRARANGIVIAINISISSREQTVVTQKSFHHNYLNNNHARNCFCCFSLLLLLCVCARATLTLMTLMAGARSLAFVPHQGSTAPGGSSAARRSKWM